MHPVASQQERPQLVRTQRAVCLPHAVLGVPAGVSECGGPWSFCQAHSFHRTLFPAGRTLSCSRHVARRVHTGEGAKQGQRDLKDLLSELVPQAVIQLNLAVLFHIL